MKSSMPSASGFGSCSSWGTTASSRRRVVGRRTRRSRGRRLRETSAQPMRPSSDQDGEHDQRSGRLLDRRRRAPGSAGGTGGHAGRRCASGPGRAPRAAQRPAQRPGPGGRRRTDPTARKSRTCAIDQRSPGSRRHRRLQQRRQPAGVRAAAAAPRARSGTARRAGCRRRRTAGCPASAWNSVAPSDQTSLASVAVLAGGDLGGEVGRRAGDQPGLGERGVGLGAGDAEVGELHLPVGR